MTPESYFGKKIENTTKEKNSVRITKKIIFVHKMSKFPLTSVENTFEDANFGKKKINSFNFYPIRIKTKSVYDYFLFCCI